jgi:hypothetical protein
LPVGQLAPQNVPQPQESQPDAPQEASQEEKPFEIELVVPESPTAQDSPAEEQQQLKDQDVEDKAKKEYPPPSDAEDEKMYRDADKVESFGVKAPFLAGRLRALLEHPGITTILGTGSRRSRVKGRWSSKPSQRFSSDPESSANTKDQLLGPLAAMLLPMPPGRPSHHGSIATSISCKTPSTTSCPTGRRINSRPTGWRRISPGWRWYTTRIWRWSWALIYWQLSVRLRLSACSCRMQMPPFEATWGW